MPSLFSSSWFPSPTIRSTSARQSSTPDLPTSSSKFVQFHLFSTLLNLIGPWCSVPSFRWNCPKSAINFRNAATCIWPAHSHSKIHSFEIRWQTSNQRLFSLNSICHFFSFLADYTRGVRKWWFMMSIKFSLVCLLLHRDVDQRGLCGHYLPFLGAQRRPGLGDQQRALVSCTRPLHSLLLQVGGDQFAFWWFASMIDEIPFPFRQRSKAEKDLLWNHPKNPNQPVGPPLLYLAHYRGRRLCSSAVAPCYSLEVAVIVLSVFPVFSVFPLVMLEYNLKQIK